MDINGNYTLTPALDNAIRTHEQKAKELRDWCAKQRDKRRNKRKHKGGPPGGGGVQQSQ